MICFVRRSTVDYDIRLRKYISACQDTSTPYLAITWDRLKNCKKVYNHELQLKVKAPYGGGLKNLLGLVVWLFFVYWHLLRHFNEYKVIHACDFDAAILVFPFKLFGKKIIFDIYDTSGFKTLESFISKASDLLILPNRLRFSQLNVEENEVKRFLEVENVPIFREKSLMTDVRKLDKKIRLSYVGTFQRNIRGLENLLKLVEGDEQFELDIAGVGDGFEDVVAKKSKRCDRIHYYGVVKYEQGLDLMGKSDFIIALYYLLAPVHRYASPNKFYESLYLGVPIITSKGTLVGKQVEDNNTGYVIDDDFDSLLHLFDEVGASAFHDNYIAKRKHCSELWQRKYATFYEHKLKGEYVGLVNDLAN